jgi:hypothetical protein
MRCQRGRPGEAGGVEEGGVEAGRLAPGELAPGDDELTPLRLADAGAWGALPSSPVLG